MPTYLVTGGAGFIGSNIVAALVEQKHSVRVLDNCSTGRLPNSGSMNGRVEFVEGDIRDLPLVREVVKGVDYVLHHAALASVELSVDDPIYTNEVNITGTLNVLVAARDANVKRLVYAGSYQPTGTPQSSPNRKVCLQSRYLLTQSQNIPVNFTAELFINSTAWKQ